MEGTGITVSLTASPKHLHRQLSRRDIETQHGRMSKMAPSDEEADTWEAESQTSEPEWDWGDRAVQLGSHVCEAKMCKQSAYGKLWLRYAAHVCWMLKAFGVE